MHYPLHGVRKCWFSMLSNFNQYCVIDSPLRNNFYYVKEVNDRHNRKCLQNIKNIKLFSWEQGLLEIRPSRRKGCQLHLTENVKMSYKTFFLLNPQNNYLFSLHQKISVEILTATYRSYFHKKITEAYASQTDLLNLSAFYGELIDFQ